MKRNKGVSMITLIITIIVIIILAAIAFVGMDDATGSAQYAKFSSEFGDYATNFTGGAVTKVQESLGLAGKVANKAQIVYCAARGVNLSEFDKVLNGVVTPSGYTSTRFQTDIKDATGATYVLATADTPCYEIKDDVMKEYKGKSFYGNANGQETHWVTATGKVFTLPGYPRTVDGEERMYISADLYYVPENGEMILASKLIAKEIEKIGDETSGATVGNQNVADAADHASPSEEDTGNPEVLAKIKVGDYVEYTPDTAEVNANYAVLTDITYTKGTPTKWRVWAIEGNDVVIMPISPVGSLTLGEYGSPQKGFDDYKNAEEIINKVCKIYTNKALGVTESSIRSLTIEDLEATNVSTLATQKLSNTDGLEYGTIKKYEGGSYFAAEYNETTGENEMLEEHRVATSSNPVTLKQTYYMSNAPDWHTLETSSDTYGTLIGNNNGWLASPCIDCRNGLAFLLVGYARSNLVIASCLLASDGSNAYPNSLGVRPLVTLSSTVLEGEGDSSNFVA